MSKLNIRIPENLQIILNTERDQDGLTVKIHHNLWMIIKKRSEDEYGYILLNPNSDTERSSGTWGLTKEQCVRLINKVIKKPTFGFGKNNEEVSITINKLITKIKQTYVKI